MSNYYPPAATPAATRSNTMAIISLIIAIITWVSGILFVCPVVALSGGLGGLVCCPLTLIGSVISAITGFVGRGQISASGGAETGDGAAMAGLILGILGLLVSLLFLCLFVLAIIGLFALPFAVPMAAPTPRFR